MLKGSLYIPPGGGGGGIGGFPKVVAVANYSAESGTLNFNLVNDPPTGDYVLNDYLVIVMGDGSATIAYGVSYMDDSGMINGGQFLAGDDFPATNANSPSSQQQSGGWLSLGTHFSGATPMIIHAVTGTPIAISITVTPSSAASAAPSVGAYGGNGYAPGDTGTFAAGDGTATYTVLTVDGSGGVLTFTAAGGTGYPDLGRSGSVVVTGAGDGNFSAILSASGGVVSSGVTETYGGFGYVIGDTGTITTGDGTAVYQVLTVNGVTGAVLTVEITNGGSDYTVSDDNATTVTTGSGDGTLQLDITALSTSLVYSYHATLVRNQ